MSVRDKKYRADTSYLSGPANSAAIGTPSLSGYTEGGNVIFYKNHYQNGPNLSPALTDNLAAQGGLRQSASNLTRSLDAYIRDKEKIYAGYFETWSNYATFSYS